MEERGIYRYKGLKRFLTLGLPRSLFRPIIYNKCDYIHANFLKTLNSSAKKIISIPPGS